MARMDKSRDAWIVGATGLVGGHALRGLLEDPHFSRVLSIVRRPSGVQHARLEEKVVDFESLSRELAGRHADVAICCLGSTIKQAGSKERFRHIDFDYVLAFAQSALSAGATHFIVVTALGADEKSRIFYNRVKGELEAALRSFGFSALTIVRPALLLGERSEKRFGERLAAPLSKLLPKGVRGIEASKVGRALVHYARQDTGGVQVVQSKDLQDFAA